MDAVISSVSDRLEREIAGRCSEVGSVGAAIGIVREQELAWTHGYGYADLNAEDPPNEDTLFRIGSITKTFTALAVFQLRDRGKLGLDDSLAEHIPEFSAAKPRRGSLEDVTLRRIMCHHSGLVGYTDNVEPYFTTLKFPDMQATIAALAEAEVAIEPDTAFKYSNLGFGLLGEVISRVTGRLYEDYVHTEILEPLGMSSTKFEPMDELGARTAVGYLLNPYGEDQEPAPLPWLGGQVAAGQLYSTVSDLAKWVSFQFLATDDDSEETHILSPRSLREMQRPQLLESGWTAGYCLPWLARRQNDDVFLGHGGAIFGFNTDISFNVERRLGVITLYNGRPAGELISKIFETVIEAEKGTEQSPPSPRRPTPVPDGLCGYLGVYVDPFGSLLKVEYRTDTLRIVGIGDGPGPPPTVLEPTDEPDLFRAAGGRAAGDPFRFIRDDDGTVTGLAGQAALVRKLVEAGD